MKIGIGVTVTDKRPYHRAYWENIIEQSSLCADMYVYFANNIEGVAAAKNECLRKLSDCDYVFLFDDDTFPIQNGWAEWFINHSNHTKNQHFAYLRNVGKIRQLKVVDGIGVYNNSAGCMMFLTKDVIDKVGAFDEQYKLYGFEHVDYSERCYRAGLTGARNVCPIGADDYIYSLDMDAWMDFEFIHHSTLSPEQMHNAVKENFELFKNNQEPVIYLPL